MKFMQMSILYFCINRLHHKESVVKQNKNTSLGRPQGISPEIKFYLL